VRPHDIFAHEPACALRHGVLLADDTDATTAAGTGWLQDEEVLEVVQLSITDKPLIVLWENVCRWAYVKLLAVLPPLLLHVAPQVGLAAEAPGTGEVVQPLFPVHASQLARSYQCRPQAVDTRLPAALRDQVKSRRLHRVHHAVVGVRVAVDAEAEVRERQQLLLGDYAYSVWVVRPLRLQEWWVVEENGWFSVRNRPVTQHNFVVRRLGEVQLFLVCFHTLRYFVTLRLQHQLLQFRVGVYLLHVLLVGLGDHLRHALVKLGRGHGCLHLELSLTLRRLNLVLLLGLETLGLPRLLLGHCLRPLLLPTVLVMDHYLLVWEPWCGNLLLAMLLL
jgi:hypothetical protein